MWMEISEGFLNPSGALGNVPWADVWVTTVKKRKCSMFRGRGCEELVCLSSPYLYPSVHGAGTDLMRIFHVFLGPWKRFINKGGCVHQSLHDA